MAAGDGRMEATQKVRGGGEGSRGDSDTRACVWTRVEQRFTLLPVDLGRKAE